MDTAERPNTAQRPARPAGTMFNIGLGGVIVLGIAFTAYMFMTSWGGASWVFGSAVSIGVGGLALLRERWVAPTAVVGLAVTAGAITVSLLAGDDLPREPAPVTALALSVLVGSAIRTLPAGAAIGIAGGGMAVTALAWSGGLHAVAGLATLAMTAALLLGPALRGIDRGRRAETPGPQGAWGAPPRS
ncbi:metal transporter [Streptomyces sp. NPDC051018]|uniref:metal transporter n=1 Tax=Streptomyces sp. NPDC051018 TaxID=3365639 RepID=UPI003788338A